MNSITEPDSFESRLFMLLNRPRYAKHQDDSGAYGRRRPVSKKHFLNHLKGEETIALAAACSAKANFLAIDIDADFGRRLPVIAQSLYRHGLDAASFATTGSAPDRGKVITTLRDRLEQEDANALVWAVVRDAVSDGDFGRYERKDLTVFPMHGDGGHVRLLGRNRRRAARNAPLEVALDLYGNPSLLNYVHPEAVRPCFTDSGERLGQRSLSKWARAFISEPFTGGHHRLFKAQVRLAHEALALHGEARAVEFLRESFKTIAEQSPGLSREHCRSLVRTDLAPRLIKYAKEKNEQNGTPYLLGRLWCPKIGFNAPKPVKRVYSALAEYVMQTGIDPMCFGITFDRVADLAGYTTKQKARDAVLRAVDCGLIVRLDNGMPKAVHQRGLCGLYGLVGETQGAEQVVALGKASPMYVERQSKRRELRLDSGPIALPVATPEVKWTEIPVAL